MSKRPSFDGADAAVDQLRPATPLASSPPGVSTRGEPSPSPQSPMEPSEAFKRPRLGADARAPIQTRARAAAALARHRRGDGGAAARPAAAAPAAAARRVAVLRGGPGGAAARATATAARGDAARGGLGGADAVRAAGAAPRDGRGFARALAQEGAAAAARGVEPVEPGAGVTTSSPPCALDGARESPTKCVFAPPDEESPRGLPC